ncbi:Gfo/Idh/MocA family protein [Arthrobacter sp. VKM Ac-2550]|uniref:Gfo/Idh/MocA family protein n=1 Tax=Crystallibacter permensis TaxID=1938888 RepID=UPI002226236C|nr:Gfo/Idh/MocA family oxidoreductase [Arthrobacter sp. VKM Ac-2550]MCW2134774.1 putative dehydrogenase [Arthrobacter sp. VKM Ac-2550]
MVSPQKSVHTIRIGIIGAGFMGSQHAVFISRQEGVELTAVADPLSWTLAGATGASYFSDHRELLASGMVDAVIIANPNAAHVSTAIDALNAGIPSLLEKPLATSLEEVQLLIGAQRNSATPVLVGHHRRHHPAVTAARAAIANGELGKIVAVNGMWLTRKADTYFDTAWRREKGAGIMLINAVHDLDLLRFLCGEIISVQATVSNTARGFAVEDTAGFVLRFENGAVGSLIASDAAVSPWSWDQATKDDATFPYNRDSFCYSIAGTAGALGFPQLACHSYSSELVQSGRADWNHELSLHYLSRDSGDSYTNQLRHFAAVVRGEVAPLITVDDAARTLAVIEASQQAAARGTAVQPQLVFTTAGSAAP